MTWQEALARELVAGGVDVAAQVPDSRLDGVVRGLAARDLRVRTLTREEECVGYAAGVASPGGRPLVLIQCSGLGNALNALGSLAIPYGLGSRSWSRCAARSARRNPSQMPLGRATTDVLDPLGVQCVPAAPRRTTSPPSPRGVLRTGVRGRRGGGDRARARAGGGREHR